MSAPMWRRMMEATRDVLGEIHDERQRQIAEKDWTPAHDDVHTHGELSYAAVVYALPVGEATLREVLWPWRRGPGHRGPRGEDRRAELVTAATLLVAEIERLDRAAETGEGR